VTSPNPVMAWSLKTMPASYDQQHGQETNRYDPFNAKDPDVVELTEEEQQQLIQLVRKYRQSWYLRRRMILKRVLKAHEFFKGNQFISFDPDSFQWFDALEAAFGNMEDSSSEDLQMYQFATNFYQMLAFAFVAALSQQTPKSRFLPDNAEREKDIATAKAASTVQEIIERKNEIKSLLRQLLFELWMSGCYFRHTRYVLDEYKAGTSKKPVLSISSQIIMPARYVCAACGTATPVKSAKHKSQFIPSPDGQVDTCKCGGPLGGKDYYPEERATMPVATQYKDVPNGMVMEDIYGPLHVDANPKAQSLAQTPILSLDMEVNVAALREMYPKKWDALRGATGGGVSPENQEEKLGRNMLYSESGSRGQFEMEEEPTYSRTWIQPWAFNGLDKKEDADKFKEKFPKGCLLCNVGETFLQARKAELLKEWTWAGTVKGKFGLFPPAVGDAAIPVQERINDTCNITHEHMDRVGAGMIFYNQSAFDGAAMNGKPLMPGVLNGLVMKRASANIPLRDQLVQIRAELDANMYSYTDKLVFWAQLLVGTPPQIFGGAGDPHVETKGGQEQQLSTAMGKLGLFWDHVREEGAKAAELGVNCAADNMSDDWFDVVEDPISRQQRNKYVRLDQMQGSIHAYPETDQGFPMTHDEIKAFWEQLIQWASSGKNPYANAMLEEPTNQEQIATWTGVPGLVVPGRAMRAKVLQIIDRLQQEEPNVVMQAVPNPPDAPPGTPVRQVQVITPSIEPDIYEDDLDVAVQTTRQWMQEHWEMADTDPMHWQNLKAYLKACVAMGVKQKAMQAQEAAMVQGAAGPQGPQGPQGKPQQSGSAA